MKKLLSTVLNFLIIGFIGFSLASYKGSIDGEVYRQLIPTKYFILCFVVTCLLTAVFSFIDFKVNYYEKFFRFLYAKRKSIAFIAVLLAVSAVVSTGIEFILSRAVFGVMSTGGYFNIYRFYFITSIVFVLIYVVIRLIKNELKLENAFAVISLAAGSVMILSAPFAHISWDTDSHIKFAVGQSNIYGYMTEAERCISQTDPRFTFMGEDETAAVSEITENIYNSEDKIVTCTTKSEVHITHLPYTVTMAVCRLLGTSFVTRMHCAQFAGLFCYTIICFLAIKRLKSGKSIMFTIALFPTALFIASNLSYDWWVTSFALLGMAYYLSEMQQPDKHITVWESTVMCGSFMLACLPKQVYFPLLLIPLTLKKNYFSVQKKQRKVHIIICIIFMALLAASLMLRASSEISVGGDMRGGANINVAKQVAFIFSNPFKYTKILLKFLSGFLSIGVTKDYTSFFAYLGYGYGNMIVLALLIIAVIADKNEYDVFTSGVFYKISAAVIFFASVCLVATSLYVSFTEVGLDTIKGCSPRYIIPLLFPLLSVIGSCKIGSKINNSISGRLYNGAFAVIMPAVLYIDIYQTMITRMM